MNKGFTLLELLVVIALLGVLLLIVVPSTIKILDGSIANTMKIQEEEVENAAKIYLEDYCKTPIDGTKMCPLSRSITNGVVYFNGEIILDTLVDNNYIDEVNVRSESCTGRIVFVDNEPDAFLSCGNVYTSEGY